MPKTPHLPTLLLAASLAFVLTACVTPYRTDVQQGNAVSTETLEKLPLSMNKRQVRFLLGTPLVTDPFRQDRWDYIYSLRNGNGPAVHQRLSLIFHNDVLVDVDGDLAPTHLKHKAASN